MMMQHITNLLMQLEQNQKLSLENILKDSFFKEKFNIYNHNLSLVNNLLSYKLEQTFTDETIDYSETPNFDSIKKIYNLNF